MTTIARLLALGIGLLRVAPAAAADQTILGSSLTVKNPTGANLDRRVTGVGKEKLSTATIVGDPTVSGPSGGAILQLFVDGGTPGSQTFALPQGLTSRGKPFWTVTRTPGFQYKDSRGEQGPVKAALIKFSSSGTLTVKAVLSGKTGTVDIVPPDPGTSGCMAFWLSQDNSGERYSVQYGTESLVRNDGPRFFKATKQTAEGICPGGLSTTTTTSSSTSTSTSTSSSTSSSTTTSSSSSTSSTESTTSTTSSSTSTSESTSTSSSTSTSTTESTTTTESTSTTDSTSSTTTSSTSTSTSSTTSTTIPCGNNAREGNEECDGSDASACLAGCTVSCVCAPPPRKISVAGDSISQAFAADCTSGGFGGALCLAAGDKPQYSWFNGTNAAVNSVHKQYQAINGAVLAQRQSVSGAEMRGTGDSFAAQASRILTQVPIPDHVEVLLGGNDICNRDCVDGAHCGDPVYTDTQWRDAVRAGLDILMGGLPNGSTVYLLGIPRVQDLRGVGLAKPGTTCETQWSTFSICRIATNGATLNSETFAVRQAGIAERQQRYNEILRDEANAYNANTTGQNPRGLEVVADYVDEVTPSVGTTTFLTTDIDAADCFHPSIAGQQKLADGTWFNNPDR